MQRREKRKLENKTLFERFVVPFLIAGLFLFGLSFYQQAPEPKNDDLKVSFLDVGQGDAALIKTPHEKYILIDGGPDKKVLEALGQNMLPTKKEIEAIILSHPHSDHVAGINYVLDRYKVGKIYMTGVAHSSPDYEVFLDKIEKKKIPAEKMFAEKEFNIDGAYFKTFWPKEDLFQKIVDDVNYSSIVFELSYKKNSFLFLGDLSAKGQEEMMGNVNLSKIDVIKVAHHGSKTGTSQNLLEHIQPKYAVISVGAENDYGHPAPSVLTLLSSQIVLLTDEKGTVTFSSDGNLLQLK